MVIGLLPESVIGFTPESVIGLVPEWVFGLVRNPQARASDGASAFEWHAPTAVGRRTED